MGLIHCLMSSTNCSARHSRISIILLNQIVPYEEFRCRRRIIYKVKRY